MNTQKLYKNDEECIYRAIRKVKEIALFIKLDTTQLYGNNLNDNFDLRVLNTNNGTSNSIHFVYGRKLSYFLITESGFNVSWVTSERILTGVIFLTLATI